MGRHTLYQTQVYIGVCHASWGWKLENKLKNEVKSQNFLPKISIKPEIFVKQDQLIFI